MSAYLRRAIVWARMLFMLPTHRIIRFAPGMYMQADRRLSSAEIAAMIGAYLRKKGIR